GAWLLERRPDKGLLGGMLGWPGSDWSDAPTPAPPIRAEWRTLSEEARHTFTHFHLRLVVKTALVPMDRSPTRGEFIELPDFSPADLPTVMRKAFDLASRG
ncbi:NUDIX domain-containing protein, partial [Citreimonas sp.]|uniref:NUDIX domain-containing protein n=1 Tax=Citreimonas sp. TaxID=3036715 RepID=UPI0035C8398C